MDGKLRLQEVTQKQLDASNKRIEEAEQKIKEYHELITKLKTLPDQLKYEKMIPIGSLAYMPGFLINTNKIQVYLADGYIIETSAKNASEVAQRQVNRYDELISKLQIEKKKYEEWLFYINETSNDNQYKNIEEYITEDEYQDMKKKHKESVKKYRKNLENSEISFENLDETVDETELEEFKAQIEDNSFEKINLYIEQMKQTQERVKDKSTLCKEIQSQNTPTDGRREEEIPDIDVKSQNSPTDGRREEEIPDIDVKSQSEEEAKKKVRWREEAEEEIPKIHFKHSPGVSKVPRSTEEGPSIQNPSDIYTHYLSSKCKPILKVPKDFVPNIQPFTCATGRSIAKNKKPVVSSVQKSSVMKPVGSSVLRPFSGEIKEASSPLKTSVLPERQQKQSIFKKMNKK